jgi:hypothetical protein
MLFFLERVRRPLCRSDAAFWQGVARLTVGAGRLEGLAWAFELCHVVLSNPRTNLNRGGHEDILTSWL